MLMSSAGTEAAFQPYEGASRNGVLTLNFAIIPELLQDAGYATHGAGKWDLGNVDGYTPADRGFDRYAGRYDDGYDALRARRFEQASEAGVLPPGSNLDDYRSRAESWSNLSQDEQRRYSRAQEIYAGMVEYFDMSVGPVILRSERPTCYREGGAVPLNRLSPVTVSVTVCALAFELSSRACRPSTVTTSPTFSASRIQPRRMS